MHHTLLGPAAALPGKAAALLMHETDWSPIKRIKMSDEDNIFADESLLLEAWDCDGCAPPAFHLPPPPRPPWLEDLDDCQQGESNSNPYQLDDWLSQMETCDNTIILDSQSYFEDTFHSIAIIVVCSIVLVIVMLGLGVFLFKRRKSLLHMSECQRHLDHPTAVAVGSSVQKQFDYGNVNQAIDLSTPTRSQTLQGHFKRSAATTLTPNGHTMTRCLDFHQSFPNHYIPDNNGVVTFSDNNVVRKQMIAEEFRTRFAPPESRNVMELSERPPMPRPNNVQPDYPHIVIGGKPFYLIPTNDQFSRNQELEDQQYAYPQHMPIYEEIDYSSDQGEVGSVNYSNRPSSRPIRPTSSAATNTSELSSVGSSNSSTNNGVNMVMNPLVNSTEDHAKRHQIRLADGVERSRSPQSIYSAKLAAQQSSSNNSSVYYYSDTLKQNKNLSSSSSPRFSSDDSTDSGYNKKAILEEDVNKGTTVETRVVLDDKQTGGSTLV